MLKNSLFSSYNSNVTFLGMEGGRGLSGSHKHHSTKYATDVPNLH